MFEPIVSNRIQHGNLDFEVHLDDVESLNQNAITGLPDITKLSFNAFTRVYDTYQMLPAGAALGQKCGPMLISRSQHKPDSLQGCRIAIPGKNTTAFLLLQYAFPEATLIEEMVFSDIEDAVLLGKADAGVIIHENRFTYQKKGLFCWQDLGDYWETSTGYPIPLGGIAIKRSLPDEIKNTAAKAIRDSVAYALNHPDSGLAYIREHAQEMDQDVMQAHIRLYVNEYSKNLGDVGKQAILHLFKHAIPDMSTDLLSDLFFEIRETP